MGFDSPGAGEQIRENLHILALPVEGLQALLPQESRITQFAENFNIISQVAGSEEALERIYGKRRPRKADCLQETSLQRAAINQRNCLGYACGIWDILQNT